MKCRKLFWGWITYYAFGGTESSDSVSDSVVGNKGNRYDWHYEIKCIHNNRFLWKWETIWFLITSLHNVDRTDFVTLKYEKPEMPCTITNFSDKY